jgi:hypothetical protein
MTVEQSNANADHNSNLAAPSKKSIARAGSSIPAVACFVLFAFAAALNASSIGLEVNGTCEGGTCPPTPLPFNSSGTLPFDLTVTLPDGDIYLIDGSFSTGNNGDGSSLTAGYIFQVTYEGNAGGGPSAADTITVERDLAYETSLSSLNTLTTLMGAFSPGIAASSAASSCINGANCIGPVNPPGSFDENSGTFSLSATNGVWVFDKTFVNDFGAGSPVGSYIVWGQTTAIPASTPEPASLGLLALGLGGIFIARRAHHPRE